MENGEAPVVTSNSTTVTVVSGLVVVSALISVALRFWARVFTKAGLGIDDWLILVAVLVTVMISVLLLWGSSIDPGGSAIIDNTDPNFVFSPENVLHLKLSFIASVLYFTATGASKLSILFMYHRLFSIDQPFRIQAYVVGVLVLTYWIGCTVASLTNCIPLEWSWINNLSDPRYCFNFNIFWMASGMGEALIDTMILAMPIRIVLSLRLSKRKKFTVSCVFLLGIFAMGTGLTKVVLGYRPNSRVPYYSRTEIWATFHVGMSIVCACLPIFKPLIKRAGGVAKLMGFSVTSFRHRSSSSRSRSRSRGWSSLGGNRLDLEQGSISGGEIPVLEEVDTQSSSPDETRADVEETSPRNPHSSWVEMTRSSSA